MQEEGPKRTEEESAVTPPPAPPAPPPPAFVDPSAPTVKKEATAPKMFPQDPKFLELMKHYEGKAAAIKDKALDPAAANKDLNALLNELKRKERIHLMIPDAVSNQPIPFTVSMLQLWDSLIPPETQKCIVEDLSILEGLGALTKFVALTKTQPACSIAPEFLQSQLVSENNITEVQKYNDKLKDGLAELKAVAKFKLEDHEQDSRARINALKGNMMKLQDENFLARMRIQPLEAKQQLQRIDIDRGAIEANSLLNRAIILKEQEIIDGLFKRVEQAAVAQHWEARNVFLNLFWPITSRITKGFAAAPDANAEAATQIDFNEERLSTLAEMISDFLIRPEDRARLEHYVRGAGDYVRKESSVHAEPISDPEIIKRLVSYVTTTGDGGRYQRLALDELAGILVGHLARKENTHMQANKPLRNVTVVNHKAEERAREQLQYMMDSLALKPEHMPDAPPIAERIKQASRIEEDSISPQGPLPAHTSAAKPLVQKAFGPSKSSGKQNASDSPESDAQPFGAFAALEQQMVQKQRHADAEHRSDIEQGRAPKFLRQAAENLLDSVANANSLHVGISASEAERFRKAAHILSEDNAELMEIFESRLRANAKLTERSKQLENELDRSEQLAEQAVAMAKQFQARAEVAVAREENALAVAHLKPQEIIARTSNLALAFSKWVAERRGKPIKLSDAKELIKLAKTSKNFLDKEILAAIETANEMEGRKSNKPRGM